MADRPHVIRRQTVDLRVGAAEEPLALQEEFARLVRDRLPPVAEKVFEGTVPADRYVRIGRLEVDLGRVDFEDSGDRLIDRMREELETALLRVLRDLPDRDRRSAAGHLVGLWQHVLETGRLPWWADRSIGGSLSEDVVRLFRDADERPAVLAAARRAIGHTRSAARRLALQHRDRFLIELADGFVSGWGARLASVLNVIERRTETLKVPVAERARTGRAFREALWTEAFEGLVTAPSPGDIEGGFAWAMPDVAAILAGALNRIDREAREAIGAATGSPELAAETTRLADRILQSIETGDENSTAERGGDGRDQRDAAHGGGDAGGDDTRRGGDGPEAGSEDRHSGRGRRRSDSAEEDGRHHEQKPAKGPPGGRSESSDRTDRTGFDRKGGRAPEDDADQSRGLRDGDGGTDGAEPVGDRSERPSEVDPGEGGTPGSRERSNRDTGRSADPSIDGSRLPTELAGREHSEGDGEKEVADPFDPAEGLVLDQAGIVLLHPFLPVHFERLGFVQEDRFPNEQAREQAIHQLHFLATGRIGAPEYELVLHKLLCGLHPDEPIAREVELEDRCREEAEKLLGSVIEHWSALKNTSLDGLRESFLQRDGRLSRKEEGWHLRVEQRTYDILLARMPWSLGPIRLEWMDELLLVDWA